MLGIYLKDVVEDEQGQEMYNKGNRDKEYEPVRRRRLIVSQAIIDHYVGHKITPRSADKNVFDILPEHLRGNESVSTFKKHGSVIKKSHLNPRYEAIATARHNLSLIG